MRKVNRNITSQRAPSAEKEQVNFLLKQASEQGTGTLRKGDGVTGAPVTEPGYKHLLPYLMRLIWRHINKLGWHHDYKISSLRHSSRGWDFFVYKLRRSEENESKKFV